MKFTLLTLAVLLTSCASIETATKLQTGPGPEDIAVIRVGKVPAALVTGTAKRTGFFADHNGKLELLSLTDSDGAFSPQSGPASFKPVGIYVVNGQASSSNREYDALVYAINALPVNKRKRTVEVFGFRDDTLEYLCEQQTPASPVINNANGIAVSNTGRIYVSNFSTPGFGKRTITLPKPTETAGERKDSIAMFDPRTNTWKHVLVGFNGANGLELLDAGKTLLVSEYFTKKVHAFALDDNGYPTSATPVGSVTIDFHPDNLKKVGQNRVSVTGQYNAISVFFHFIWSLLPASGEASILRMHEGKPVILESGILAESGLSDRNAPSTVVRAGDNYFISHIVRDYVWKIPVHHPIKPSGSSN